METNKVLDNLKRQCSRREYCVSDVMQKALKALDGDRQKAEEVVGALVEEKYVDDRRYCSAYAREKSSISGWGLTKIRYMLSAKGISKEIIASALEDIDLEKAGQRLEKLLSNKFKTLQGDPQWKMKLLRFALGRGYGYDEVNQALKNIEGL